MEKCPRMIREEAERSLICSHGVLSSQSRGRLYPEEECPLRTCFQRDIDRITHSKSFRRLKHKTQVFLQPEGDHYRTRLTHTLEVTRLARTAARALCLNEDLAEAIALGHDLGHTPFGHAGERALRDIHPGGFHHYEQSLRVIDSIEKDGEGLNLCYETRMGILNHTHGSPEDSREATLVRFADRIAYINHDLDDALRAGLLTLEDVPSEIRDALGDSNSQRINAIISDLILNSREGEVSMSPAMWDIYETFHNFMYERVYYNPVAKSEESKVKGIIGGIYEYYVSHSDKLPDDYKKIAQRDGLERSVCDYVAGMTDKYALEVYSNIFIPMAWTVK